MIISLLWTFIMAVSAVNCGFVSENYVIDMPDVDAPKADNTPFQIYWNVPTKQCRSKKIPFDDLLRKFKISYNKDDRFEGETITIIYKVGLIPAVLRRDGGKFSVQNGGLPQEGNLELHLAAFRETVMRYIPDPDFNGVGVLDMEDWRPIFRQQWGNLVPISDLSLSIEKRKYWWWPALWQKMEATKRFEDAARVFMEKTLSTAKQMRPKASWGYYGFPYCFNMEGKNNVEHCSKDIKAENDRTYWLWAESTALYPSVYSKSTLSTSELEKLVRGRLTEANRVKKAGDLVIPYFSITYRNGDFFKEKDVIAVFETLQKKNASGLIIWGASADVNTVDKCKQLFDYVNSNFGPIAKKYIQRVNKLRENTIQTLSINIDDSNDTLNNSTSVTTTTHTTTFKSSEDNNVRDNIPTTQISNEPEPPLNKSFYETDDSKINSEGDKESGIWSISKNNFADVLNNKNDNLITLFETTNNNGSYNIKQLKLSTSNLTNPVNILDINSTQNNVEKEQQFKKYYYENNGSRVELNDTNESDIWSIIKYETSLENENITETITEQFTENPRILVQNHTGGYLNLSTTTNTISNNKSKECKDKSETFLITIENSTSCSNETKNNTQTYILNDLIKSIQNTIPSNISVIDNITDITPEIIKIILLEQEEQPNDYYYKIDNTNEELRNSNESDIWNIVNNETRSETENIVESIQSEQYSSINGEDTEVALENVDSTSVLEFTSCPPNSSSKPNSQNVTEASIENDVSDYFITVRSDSTNLINASINGDEAETNLKNSSCLELNIFPPNSSSKHNSQNVTQASIENDVSDYFITVRSDSTNLINASINGDETETNLKNSSCLELNIFPPNSSSKPNSQNVTQASIENDVSDYFITVRSDSTNLINASINGDETETNLKNSSCLELNIFPPNSSSKHNSQNVTQASIENDVSDYFITVRSDSTNLINASINGDETETNLKNSSCLELNIFPPNSSSKHNLQNVKQASIENDVSDYLITVRSDSTNLINASINGDETETNLKNSSCLELNIFPPNSSSKHNSQNVKQASIENYVSDYLITVRSDSTNLINASINGDETETNLKNSSCLELIIFPPNSYSKNISQNVKEEEKLLNHPTYGSVSGSLNTLIVDYTNSEKTSMNDTGTKTGLENKKPFSKNMSYTNIETTTNEVNNVSDYLVILAEDFTNRMNTTMTSNAYEIIKKNSKDLSQKVKHKEQLLNYTSDTNIEENDVPGFLIPLTVDFSKYMNASINQNSTKINLENKEPFTKNTTFAYIETTTNNNNVSDDSMVFSEQFSNLSNTSINGNGTKLELGNEEQFTKKITNISDNVQQVQQIVRNNSFSNVEAKAGGKYGVSGFLPTLRVDFTNSVNALMNTTKINIETAEQFMKNTTYSNIENTTYVVDNVSDYSMMSAEDLTSLMNMSINGNDTKLSPDDITYPNIETTTNGASNITDYSMILAGNFTSPMNTSMTVDADDIINIAIIEATASEENDVSDYLYSL